MKVGFIGIGLIGGSILKRLASCGVECFVYDKNDSVINEAITLKNVEKLTNFNNLDIILLSLPPQACENFIKENHTKIGTILICDVCGVKNHIQNLADKYKLNYCGIHPMAGREIGGFANSKENLFNGANVVITTENPPQIIYEVIHLLGFGKIVYSNPDKHDKIISYTSQLCHIVSNAYAKNPLVLECDGFTGGSFEDLTRVGKMDSNLWVELFDKNRDNLICDIDTIIKELQKYYDCLNSGDNQKLKQLIEEGSNLLQKQLKNRF